DERGRRIHGRSEEGAQGHVHPAAHLPGGPGQGVCGDGRQRVRAVQGELAAHRGVQHQPARRDGADPCRRARRHDRSMTPIQDHVRQSKQAMDKAVEPVKREFATVRTGKATTSLLDLVKVEAYGSEMPLNQVASVAAPEPKLLTVQPWDKALIKAVEKAILASDLGLNPANDGNLIRIPLPPLTEERRRELVKVVHKFAEEGRVAIRHARIEAGVEVLTLFAFSEENWQRPPSEISALMGLLEEYIAKECEELRGQGVQVSVLGDRGRLAGGALAAVERIERETRSGKRLALNLCISYSSRAELARAARLLAEEVLRGTRRLEAIDEGAVGDKLYTGPSGEPDLLIRTSGEQLLSNFLLWQLAYAELYLTGVLWPD